MSWRWALLVAGETQKLQTTRQKLLFPKHPRCRFRSLPIPDRVASNPLVALPLKRAVRAVRLQVSNSTEWARRSKWGSSNAALKAVHRRRGKDRRSTDCCDGSSALGGVGSKAKHRVRGKWRGESRRGYRGSSGTLNASYALRPYLERIYVHKS